MSVKVDITSPVALPDMSSIGVVLIEIQLWQPSGLQTPITTARCG